MISLRVRCPRDLSGTAINRSNLPKPKPNPMRRKLQANAVQYSTLIVLWHAPTSPSYKAGTKAHLLQKQRQSRIDSESDGSARTSLFLTYHFLVSAPRFCFSTKIQKRRHLIQTTPESPWKTDNGYDIGMRARSQKRVSAPTCMPAMRSTTLIE